jgi:hypothetical protein
VSLRPKPSIADAAVAQSLRDLEDSADRVITQIHWDAIDPNIRGIGDALAHKHDDRTKLLKDFMNELGVVAPAPSAPQAVCFAQDAPSGAAVTPVDDPTLLNRLLLHHDCGQRQARVLEKSRSDASQKFVLDLLNSYDADVRLVHRVRGDQ